MVPMTEVRTEANEGQRPPVAGGADAPPTARVRVRRLAERGRYDRATIEAILDEGFIGHVGVVVDGYPVVIPTAYARIDDRLYLHGAPANATLGQASSGFPVCVTVTLVDGLVIARSAFHHSINYRSVVVYGTGTQVTDPEEKRVALAAVVEHIVPGRGADARPPTPAELRATRVVRIPLDEASAKIRAGGPKDDPEDMALPVWAGQVPLRMVPSAPVAEADVAAVTPGYLIDYARPPGRGADDHGVRAG
jgi:nitroimidazol reductase NimA-like FMN-containing flavoprotein (pyridoxamine 5'-phosphate oxidase superfamily)